MKTKSRILMVLIGVTVAIITAGVPSMKQGGKPQTNPKPEVKECYSESEVQILMRLNGCSRETAVEILNLSCEYAVTF